MKHLKLLKETNNGKLVCVIGMAMLYVMNSLLQFFIYHHNFSVSGEDLKIFFESKLVRI